MSLPHLFQIKNFSSFKEISDFFLFLRDELLKNPSKFTEKLDGIHFAVQKIDEKWFFVDKFGKKLSLFEIIQSKWPEHLKTKFAKLLKKVSTTLENDFSDFFLRFKEHIFVFEYLNKKQNIIEYNDEYFILLYVENEKTKEKINVFDDFRPSRISQIFDHQTPGGYYPTNKASDHQKPLRISQIFDLPGHSLAGGLAGFGVKQLVGVLRSQEETFEKKLFQFYLECSNNFISNIIFEHTFGLEREGVVVSELAGLPTFKITGEFMLKNISEENKFGSRFYLLAGMKPPHKGHLHLIKETLKQVKKYNSKLNILLTEAKRDNFDLEVSLKILKTYIENEGLDGGLIRLATPPDNRSFDFLIEELKTFNSGDVVYLVSSEIDQERTREQVLYLKKNFEHINFELLSIREMNYESTNRKISSTDMRKYINSKNYNMFYEFLPESSKKDAEIIWKLLTNSETRTMLTKTFLPILVG